MALIVLHGLLRKPDYRPTKVSVLVSRHELLNRSQSDATSL